MATASFANQYWIERYLSLYAATHPESFRRYIRNLAEELTQAQRPREAAHAVYVAAVRCTKALAVRVSPPRRPHLRVSHRPPAAVSSGDSSGGGADDGDGPADPPPSYSRRSSLTHDAYSFGQPCPRCGSDMVQGPDGLWWSCTSFPTCRATIPMRPLGGRA